MDRISNTSGIAALTGMAIGDALGLPVQFLSRDQLRSNPINGMTSFTFPEGTWSDDTSLTIATIDAIYESVSTDCVEQIQNNFVSWLRYGKFTPCKESIDVGYTTALAIKRYMNGVTDSGLGSEKDNGNGSLMRMLPYIFALFHTDDSEERRRIIFRSSAITHAHIRSQAACYIYEEFGRYVLGYDMDVRKAYKHICKDLSSNIENWLPFEEVRYFERILSGKLQFMSEDQIKSSGYVVDTLEASIWCLLHTDSFSEAVLTAVNFGGDTDTIAAIVGGIAGIQYGYKAIPQEWIESLLSKEIIDEYGEKLHKLMVLPAIS